MKKDTVMRLFSQYGNDLYRFALSYVGSKCEAEDIVQDVFVKLISRPFVIRHRSCYRKNKEQRKGMDWHTCCSCSSTCCSDDNPCYQNTDSQCCN